MAPEPLPGAVAPEAPSVLSSSTQLDMIIRSFGSTLAPWCVVLSLLMTPHRYDYYVYHCYYQS